MQADKNHCPTQTPAWQSYSWLQQCLADCLSLNYKKSKCWNSSHRGNVLVPIYCSSHWLYLGVCWIKETLREWSDIFTTHLHKMKHRKWSSGEFQMQQFNKPSLQHQHWLKVTVACSLSLHFLSWNLDNHPVYWINVFVCSGNAVSTQLIKPEPMLSSMMQQWWSLFIISFLFHFDLLIHNHPVVDWKNKSYCSLFVKALTSDYLHGLIHPIPIPQALACSLTTLPTSSLGLPALLLACSAVFWTVKWQSEKYISFC